MSVQKTGFLGQMEIAGQALSASPAYSTSIRRKFVAWCAAATDGYRRGEGEGVMRVAVVGSRVKEKAEEH